MLKFIKCFRKFVVVFLLPFLKISERNIPFFTFFSDQSQVYHLGSNYNNRRGDLDTAIKKVSPVEQRLIYQSWHVWIHSWRVNVKCKFEMKKLDRMKVLSMIPFNNHLAKSCCFIWRAGSNCTIVSRSGYIWMWSGARDQESTNHRACFA